MTKGDRYVQDMMTSGQTDDNALRNFVNTGICLGNPFVMCDRTCPFYKMDCSKMEPKDRAAYFKGDA